MSNYTTSGDSSNPTRTSSSTSNHFHTTKQLLLNHYSLIYNFTPYFDEIKNTPEALIIFEIYQHLNLINIKTLHCLFQQLEHINSNTPIISNRLDFIFTIKLCNQLCLLSALYFNKTEILKILEFIQHSTYSVNFEIDKILDNIIYLPKLESLFTKLSQISLWETNSIEIIKKITNCKRGLFQSFVDYFKQIPSQFPFICEHKLKLFEVKKYILHYVEESRVNEVYESLRNIVRIKFLYNYL